MFLFIVEVICLLIDYKCFATSDILTCTEIETKGSGAALDVQQLVTLSKTNDDDLAKCFILLGKEPLSPEVASVIWTSILDVYGSAENVPEERLQQLGWISAGIPSSEFLNLTFTDVDTVSAFGRLTYLSPKQMEGLKQAVMEQWCGKSEEDLTSYDLVALRQILCAFNASSIQMIHPESYKDAASELATLYNCSDEVLKELAHLAMSQEAFGDSSTWTSIQVANVGCVISGLESVSKVSAIAMDGITPDIIKCLPQRVLKEMSEEQIRNLAPVAASAMSAEQISALDKNKKYALEQAILGLSARDANNGVSSSFSPSLMIVPFIYLSGFNLFPITNIVMGQIITRFAISEH